MVQTFKTIRSVVLCEVAERETDRQTCKLNAGQDKDIASYSGCNLTTDEKPTIMR